MKTITYAALFLTLVQCGTKHDQIFKNVFPYLITEDYLSDGIQNETIFLDTLTKGIYLTVVQDLGGLFVQNIKISDLESSGIPFEKIREMALKNLETSLSEQNVKMMQFADGPNDTPFVLVGGHWLASSSIYGEKMFMNLSKVLDNDSLYFSIPHRDALIVFPKCEEQTLSEFKKMIKEKESDGRKKLTWQILLWTKEGFFEK